MNHIDLMGRLVRDPELRYTQSQTPVASFTLAVDRRQTKSGEKVTDFIDCVAWRTSAEFVSKWFRKGMLMAVSGSLQIREWQDKDNNKRRSAEVVVEQIDFCGDRAKNQEGAPAPAPAQDSYTAQTFTELDDDDGELPF